MANHLDLFFNASSIQGRLVLMISFLGGEARRIALDQVAFLFVRQFILKAANEQLSDPSAQLLKAYGEAKGAWIIEMLVKPGEFSKQAEAPKHRYNLNNTPAPKVTKRKGIYANQTPQRGRGRGNFSWRPSTPTTASTYHPGASGRFNKQTPPAHTSSTSIGQSPLQRCNIQFMDMWSINVIRELVHISNPQLLGCVVDKSRWWL